MTDQPIEISAHASLSDIPAEAWDACAAPEAATGRPLDPFTTHRFLLALEDSGSVGPGTGWQPRYLTAKIDDQIIAVAPLYAKGHSQGEYIFDHNWAHAFEQAGGQYYPKLQMTVPFTPATGRRFLTRPGLEDLGRAALVQGAIQIAEQNDLSSVHITFCTQAEAKAGAEMGLLHRNDPAIPLVQRRLRRFRRLPRLAVVAQAKEYPQGACNSGGVWRRDRQPDRR